MREGIVVRKIGDTIFRSFGEENGQYRTLSRMVTMIWLSAVGSVASILGLLVALYVLWREVRIADDVTTLKTEEEQWHGIEKRSS